MSQLLKDYKYHDLTIDLSGRIDVDDAMLHQHFTGGDVQWKLDLGGTSVTEAGILELVKTCPNLLVKYVISIYHSSCNV